MLGEYGCLENIVRIMLVSSRKRYDEAREPTRLTVLRFATDKKLISHSTKQYAAKLSNLVPPPLQTLLTV